MENQSPAHSTLFDQDFLSQLEGLVLLARQLARSRNRADRRSSQRGASVEFAEYRPFQPGDDWRYIDWNAYARWRTLVLKLFAEDQDLPVWILVDATPSMAFGSPTTKWDHARRLAAGLAYIALSSHDRVGLAAPGAASLALLTPARGRHNFQSILRFLEQLEPGEPGASLEHLISRWLGGRPQRGMVIWITDHWGNTANDAANALHRLRHSRNEVSLVHITAPAEAEAGTVGEYRLECIDGGEPRTVIVDEGVRRAYRQRYATYCSALNQLCRGSAIPLLPASTAVDCVELLTRSLHQKGFVQ